MASAMTRAMVERIERESRRLDALEVGHGGVVVLADDTLPDGWVQIADKATAVYGPSWEILERLEDALPGETIDPQDPYDRMGDHRGYEALWDALRDERGCEPGADVWREYHEFVKGVTVGDLGLTVHRTNAGLRWGFAPTGADFSAFNTTHDYSELFESAEDALDAARSWEAQQRAEVEF